MLKNVKRSRRWRVSAMLTALALVAPPVSALAQARVTRRDADHYADGRGEEIRFTGAALAMMACATSRDQLAVLVAGASPDHAERAAAARVGMRVVDYRALVARVDSTLRQSSELDATTRRLDSLRVRLTVLRTRVSAELSPSVDSAHSRRSACNTPEQPLI
ncbi:MAG TPA: hypothetical protein VF483_09085 [Gemmatimonadaceae bacterium]